MPKAVPDPKMMTLAEGLDVVDSQDLLKRKPAPAPAEEPASIDFAAPEFQENAPAEQPTFDPALIGTAAKDLAKGVAAGVEQAGRGVVESSAVLGQHLLPPGMRDMINPGGKPVLGEPMIDAPEGLPAQILRDVTQFGIGFVGGMKALEGARLASGVKEVVASGVGTGVVADPNAPRLANLLQQHHYLEGPVRDFLAADPSDGVAEGKLKAALEDMMLTPVALVLFKILKAAKSAFAGNADEASKLSDEIIQDVKVANGETPDASVGKTLDANGELTIPETVVTPEKTAEELAAADAKAAAEYSQLQRVTKGGEHYNALSETQRAKFGAQLAENPESTFKLSLGKDGEVRAYKNAVVINDKAGKPLFSLTDDELTQFGKHVDYMVSQNRLEDVFNFPEFSLFNARQSKAGYDTQEVLDSMWRLVKPHVDKSMGDVRRHEETLKFANVMGEDPAALMGNIRMVAKHADDFDKYLVGGKALLYDMAREARSLKTRVNHGIATPEEMRSLQYIHESMVDLMGSVTSLRKGTARATSAGNIKTGGAFNDKAMEDLSRIAQTGDVQAFAQRLALAGDDPADIIRLIKGDSLAKRLLDAHNEYFISNLLFIKTNVVNIAGAISNNFVLPMNKIVGGAVTGSKADMAEGMAIYRGLYTNFFDAWSVASRAFKQENAILDSGAGTIEQSNHAITAKKFEEELQAMGTDAGSWYGKGIDFLGKAARLNTRFLTAEDEFFKQISYRSKVSAMAAREAADLVQAGKLDPTEMITVAMGGKIKQITAVDKFIQDKFEAAFNPAGGATNDAALKYAREITFTQDLRDIKTWDWMGNPGASLQEAVIKHPWMRGTILPFVKVPTNLLRAVGDYTPPIALLKKQFYEDVNSGDPSRKADAYGRMTMGLSFWTGGTMLAMNGRITGAAYGDKDMRARQEEDPNWQPYSLVFTINGQKQYLSYQRLDPFSTFLGLSADFHYLSGHLDEKASSNFAVAATLAVAKSITSKSYLQGLTEQLSILGGGYSAEDHAMRFFQTKVASYVPASVSAFTGNDELKDIRSIMDGLLAKTPGYSTTVEAKRDYFGEKRATPDGYPFNVINPFPVKGGDPDPVREELARLARSKVEARFHAPDKMLGTLDLTTIRNAKGQTAHDRQQELLQTVTDAKGQTFYVAIKETISSDAYKNGTDGTSAYHAGNRVVDLRKKADLFHAIAERVMKREFKEEFDAGKISKDIMAMTITDDANARAVQHGRPDRVQDILNLP